MGSSDIDLGQVSAVAGLVSAVAAVVGAVAGAALVLS